MDALLREKEAFKKRAMAVPVIESRPTAAASSSQPAQASTSADQANGKKFDFSSFATKSQPKKPVMQGHNFAVLTKIVQSMQKRHLSQDYEALEFDDLLEEANVHDITEKQRNWLLKEALPNNPKVSITPDGRFAYKPVLDIKDRQSFLNLLNRYMQRGLGAITYSDVKESLPNADKIIAHLLQKDRIIQVIRPSDKEKLFFLNEPETKFHFDEDIQKIWRSVTLDGLDENKIDEYLRSHGISHLTDPRSKVIVPQTKQKEAKKRKANFKRHNTHMEGILEDYDDKK